MGWLTLIFDYFLQFIHAVAGGTAQGATQFSSLVPVLEIDGAMATSGGVT